MIITELFKPGKKEIISIKKHIIDVHEIRQIYKRQDGSTYPNCDEPTCKKAFEYGDKYFYCITNPIRIRKFGYGRICFNCGIKLLNKITFKQKILNMKQLFLE